jgi:hypothetical protein
VSRQGIRLGIGQAGGSQRGEELVLRPGVETPLLPLRVRIEGRGEAAVVGAQLVKDEVERGAGDLRVALAPGGPVALEVGVAS